jgi:hypothetical protein
MIKAAPSHICPRCLGDVPNTARRGEYPGALSRADNATEICSDCGTHEALQDFFEGGCTPKAEWPIAQIA